MKEVYLSTSKSLTEDLQQRLNQVVATLVHTQMDDHWANRSGELLDALHAVAEAVEAQELSAEQGRKAALDAVAELESILEKVTSDA